MTAMTTKRISIGRRHVTLTLTAEGAFFAQWQPDIPHKLTKIDLHTYTTARDELISATCQQMKSGQVTNAYSKAEWEGPSPSTKRLRNQKPAQKASRPARFEEQHDWQDQAYPIGNV